MGRPLRLTNPDYIHVISLRTRGARLLLRPSKRVTNIIGGVIARYQQCFGIRLHAYKCLGNHYHLVLSDPLGNLWRFEQSVNREISRRLNWELHHEGSIWSRRYDDLIAVEGADAIDAIIYVTLNCVRHGLTFHPKDWPGLNCYEQLRDGKPRTFTFINYSAYSKAKLRIPKVRLEDFASEHQLILTPLPSLGVETIEEQWNIIAPFLQSRLAELRKEKKLSARAFRNTDYKKQNPFSKPREVSHSNRPVCFTKSLSAKIIFKEFYRSLLVGYREISKRFRAGDYSLIFPPHTLKPPLHCVPLN